MIISAKVIENKDKWNVSRNKAQLFIIYINKQDDKSDVWTMLLLIPGHCLPQDIIFHKNPFKLQNNRSFSI